MKGIKCIKYLILCITCVLLSSLYLDANAVEYSDSSYININGGTLICTNQSYTLNSNATGGAGFAAGNIAPGQCSYASLYIPSGASIPANSIIAVTVKTAYRLSGSEILYPQVGWSARSQGYGLIDNVYGEYGTTTIYLYVDQAISGSLDISPSTFFGNFTYLEFRVSPIYYVALEYTPTRAQIQSIITKLNTYDSTFSNINSNLQDIKDYLEEQEDQEQEDRDNIETQQEETNEQANDTSSDVQGATTNIIGVISGFSDALNNIQTGNCTLPTISAYGFSLGNINLCTYSPPSWVQGAVSIVVSFITLKLAIAVFYRIMGALDGVLGGKK